MKRHLRKILLASILVTVLFAVIAAIIYIVIEIDHARTDIIETEEIELIDTQSSVRNSKVIFNTTAVNKAKYQWEFVIVVFIIKSEDGVIIEKCEGTAYAQPFKGGPVKIEAECPGELQSIKEYTYEPKVFAAYKK